MSSSTVLLALAVFGACAVEAVEALTIVLAAGTRSWRSALEGAVVAVVVLAVIVGAVGVPLIRLVPIDALRVVIGALLLVVGLQWLRKAILRASGLKALHDEDAIYQETVRELSHQGPAEGMDAGAGGVPQARLAGRRDALAFTVAFKGVLLEGMEVVLVVISLGASAHELPLASLAAAAAVILVTVVGAVVARQLSNVPENSIKIVVGVMLTSFGTFWIGEGAGIAWPGTDLWILALVVAIALCTAVTVRVLRARTGRGAPLEALATQAPDASR